MSKSNQSLLNQLLSRDLTYTYHCSPSQNIGNIGLLNLFSEQNLIEALTAKKLISAYRLYRELQHQLGLETKLDGKIKYSEVTNHPAEVVSIWKSIFNS